MPNERRARMRIQIRMGIIEHARSKLPPNIPTAVSEGFIAALDDAVSAALIKFEMELVANAQLKE